ncbi:MAG: hypothetical protein E7645_08475 [Ruminococcaceae bacterium]|nr:hypothetical protein [Oscillospiraceae bacterium]
MDHSECQPHLLHIPSPEEAASSFQGIARITGQCYRIADTLVYCWLCEATSEDSSGHHRLRINRTVHEVYLYSAPCGMLRISSPSTEIAEKVFSLLVKYDVSPYHAEDILEDQELPVRIQYL